MDKYIPETGAGENGESIEFGVSSEFGELMATAGLIEAKETRASLIEGIGVGGSILSFPQVHEDRIYFGACDKNVYCIDMNGKEIWRFPTDGVVLSSTLIFKIGAADSRMQTVTAS